MIRLNPLKQEFLSHCEVAKGLSEKTIRAYRIDLEQFIEFGDRLWPVIPDEGTIKEIIREWVKSLQQKWKVKTVKRKVATLKAFFNYLEFEEIFQGNPMRKLRFKIKPPQTLPTFMTLEEVAKILKITRRTFEASDYSRTPWAYVSNLRNLAILELLFATGIRVSELCALTNENVDLENGWMVVMGKGAKERLLHLGQKETVRVLKRYKKHTSGRDRDPFFLNRLGNSISSQSVRTMIKKQTKKAKIEKKITPHTFRHTFATLLLEEGVDIKYIQQFLGHSSIMTTQIYTHVSRKKHKEILIENHPRGRI